MENQEAKTSDYNDVKKMQDAIVKHSDSFVKLGLAKLVGTKDSIKVERERISNELKENGVSQCSACNQTIRNTCFIETDTTKTCSHEAKRIKKEAKDGTICQCCGNPAKVITHKLDFKKAIALIEIIKFFRHSEKADQDKYYTKEDFFEGVLEEYGELFEGFEELHFWDLIARMPTHPEKVIYKEGYFGITENGIKFAQREIGVPQTAYSYNGEIESYESDFITIEKIINDAGLDYEELIKV
tara:strand:+ start:1792 stop:2517 length:726 start_codon:yes stop_codon:yes gene_type:complete